MLDNRYPRSVQVKEWIRLCQRSLVCCVEFVKREETSEQMVREKESRKRRDETRTTGTNEPGKGAIAGRTGLEGD